MAETRIVVDDAGLDLYAEHPRMAHPSEIASMAKELKESRMQLKTGGWDKEPCTECGVEETLRPGTELPWTCDTCLRDSESYNAGYKSGYAAGLQEAMGIFASKLEELFAKRQSPTGRDNDGHGV